MSSQALEQLRASILCRLKHSSNIELVCKILIDESSILCRLKHPSNIELGYKILIDESSNIELVCMYVVSSTRATSS
jgi:hypothetical protein